MTALSTFRAQLTQTSLSDIANGLIGRDIAFETPFGSKKLLYADYVASGRALRQVENFIAEEVLPYYANSHTEASFCGAKMTRMREEAREIIATEVQADDDCHVIFTGSGATAGINRIVGLLNIAQRIKAGEEIIILIGPYEHHSNILPWRETGAQIIEINEAPEGGVDLSHLTQELLRAQTADLIIGAFSAASNVTGMITDPDPVTRQLKFYGALAIWDYAGGAPYLEMNMSPAPDCLKDAIVFSPHKFPGGPGASGVLVVRDIIVQRQTPTLPGGGTVSFVSPWRHEYANAVRKREEAGTPNVIGDIRAALAMLVKAAIGVPEIQSRDEVLRQRALLAWSQHPNIRLLGQKPHMHALPIFSFQIIDAEGKTIHHQLFTRMLSDHLGIQARGGCACAGAYAHRLLGINEAQSNALFERLAAGHETEKPGWIRLNFSYLHTDDEVQRIIEGVAMLASQATERAKDYVVDPQTARFRVVSPQNHDTQTLLGTR